MLYGLRYWGILNWRILCHNLVAESGRLEGQCLRWHSVNKSWQLASPSLLHVHPFYTSIFCWFLWYNILIFLLFVFFFLLIYCLFLSSVFLVTPRKSCTPRYTSVSMCIIHKSPTSGTLSSALALSIPFLYQYSNLYHFYINPNFFIPTAIALAQVYSILFLCYSRSLLTSYLEFVFLF